jgi:predicted permease
VSDTPIVLPAALDLRTIAFVVALTLAVGVLLGLLPAMRITNAGAATGLREQGRGIAGSVAWRRIGKVVIVGQLALSLPLLVGAGLLVRTLMNLQQVDLGYPKDGLLTVRIDARAAGYDAPRQAAAIDQLLEQIRALPGVAAAAYSNNGLFGGSDSGDRIIVEGYTPAGDGDGGSSYDQVGAQYFSTIGVPIRLGREITGEDRAGGRMVCVINDAFARRFFDGRNPLGQHVTQVYGEERHTYEIVGVARDSRQNRLRGEVEHRFYVPATQPSATIDSVSFLVRPRGGAAAVLADVRRVIQEAEPRMAISSAGTLADAVNGRMKQDRLLARMSVAFGMVAVLLAAIGIYGVLSYGVARRTSEIGIRKALGAQRGAVMAMILRETAWLLLAGIAAGVGLALATIRLIASRLYDTTPTDPLTFVLAVAGLVVVAALATCLPAYRASRVDPLIALRQE